MAMAFVALLIFWFRTRDANVKFTVASIQVETLVLEPYLRDQDYRESVVSFRNHSPYSIWYWGDRFSGPDHFLHEEFWGCWNQCGFSTNNSVWVELQSGKSVDVRMRLNDESTAFKLGLTVKTSLFGERTELFSDEFSMDDLEH